MSQDSFAPYVPANKKIKEFSLRATLLGLVFGFFFAVANGYLALKIGTTISASIPAAILSMAILKFLFRSPTILENNIVQTIATIGEGLASGVIFTIPGLILLGDSPSTGRIFLLASLGGILGILFMIPMRRFLIVEEHKKLPFPEGTACAKILRAGQKDGKTALLAAWGVLAAALYKLGSSALFLWKEIPTWTLSFLKKTQFSIDATPALLGVGYIIGFRTVSFLFAGGAAAWWVLIPLIKTFGIGNNIIYPSSTPILDMSADAIWDEYIRYIGAGAIATGGIASLIKVIPLLYQTLSMSIKELFRGFSARPHLARTDKDIPMPWLILGAISVILTLWLFPGLSMNLFTIVLLTVLAFFFVCVTSMTVGIVGSTSNPVSGMVLTTLLITCIAFVLLGWTERFYLISAMTMGCVACCAICLAGTTSQDLKTGFLLGATPRSQQLAEILGVFIPSVALSYTIYLLNATYHIGSTALPAPQASLLALVVEGVIHGNLPFILIGIGVILGLIVGIFKIPILPFALGVYLPLSLSTAMMVGALVKAYVDRHSDEEAQERGLLIASGMIGGDACMGILIALLAILRWINPETPSALPDWTTPVIFFLLALGLGFFALKKKSKEKKRR